MKPCRWWYIYHMNWCRISSINSTTSRSRSFRMFQNSLTSAQTKATAGLPLRTVNLHITSWQCCLPFNGLDVVMTTHLTHSIQPIHDATRLIIHVPLHVTPRRPIDTMTTWHYSNPQEATRCHPISSNYIGVAISTSFLHSARPMELLQVDCPAEQPRVLQ